MKILIACDKFKDSLSAVKVCNALAEGLKNNPAINIVICPMADGGDGSLETLNHYLNLKPIKLTVNDPLFRPIKSTYYSFKKVAYIEMASASGLVLLKKQERDCMITTSFGTGQLIADAVKKGATTINLFIGGSATNDGGIGIAAALGYRFYDASGNILLPIGKNLSLINHIDNREVFFNVKEVLIRVVCDVNNPFHGNNGAAYIYASQKGAGPSEIAQLNQGLINLSSKLIEHGFPDIADISGSGAAGGVGGGAMAFLGAQLVSGVQNFTEITQLDSLIQDCDLVITGEGKLDAQTQHGKVISGVCHLAKQHNKSVIAVCGDAEIAISKKLGLQKVYTISDRVNCFEDSIEKAEEYLVAIGITISNTIK